MTVSSTSRNYVIQNFNPLSTYKYVFHLIDHPVYNTGKLLFKELLYWWLKAWLISRVSAFQSDTRSLKRSHESISVTYTLSMNICNSWLDRQQLGFFRFIIVSYSVFKPWNIVETHQALLDDGSLQMGSNGMVFFYIFQVVHSINKKNRTEDTREIHRYCNV